NASSSKHSRLRRIILNNVKNQDDAKTKEKPTARTERSLRPITIKQAVNALMEDEDHFLVDGVAVYNVCLVGAIRCISQFDTFATILIEDGTGCIDLKIRNEPALDSKEDVLSVLKADQTHIDNRIGIHIKAIGRLKYACNKLLVAVTHIRLIEDMNEFTFQMLDAIHHHLTLIKKAPVVDKSLTLSSDILSTVKKEIKECSGKDGTHIQVICQNLSSVMDESKIIEAIEELMFEGQVYRVTNELIKTTD
ncbi:Replication factor A protein 2, partial [Choanephora cucurbitarum]